MKKLTLTVLHKLPNRVRFKVSHEIIDTKKFFETIKVGAKSTALRYNKTINTLLITFEPEEITIDEVIYRTATALSVEQINRFVVCIFWSCDIAFFLVRTWKK